MATTLSPLLLASDLMFIQNDNDYVSADPQKLLNPNRTAMLVDEFRFSKNPGNGTFSQLDLSELLVNIKFGASKLTNNYVPLRAFAPTYFTYPLTQIYPSLASDQTLCWHLPRPLYVPPDVQINVSLKRKVPPPIGGNFAAPSVDSPVIFTIAGRSIPAGQPVPKTIYVPFACATSVFDKLTTFESTDADIVNPFDTPMRTSYFTGFNQRGFNEGAEPQPILVQATLSNGKMFIRDQTPFFVLFPPNRPLLRSRGLLQPKEFIRFQLSIQQPDLNPQRDIPAATLQLTMLGMVGYRELPTPMGALP